MAEALGTSIAPDATATGSAMAEPQERDFFISFSHRNMEKASSINQALLDSGFTTFFLPARDTPGSNFVDRIDQAIARSALLLGIVCPGYVESVWTKREWEPFLLKELAGGEERMLFLRVEPGKPLEGLRAARNVVPLTDLSPLLLKRRALEAVKVFFARYRACAVPVPGEGQRVAEPSKEFRQRSWSPRIEQVLRFLARRTTWGGPPKTVQGRRRWDLSWPIVASALVVLTLLITIAASRSVGFPSWTPAILSGFRTGGSGGVASADIGTGFGVEQIPLNRLIVSGQVLTDVIESVVSSFSVAGSEALSEGVLFMGVEIPEVAEFEVLAQGKRAQAHYKFEANTIRVQSTWGHKSVLPRAANERRFEVGLGLGGNGADAWLAGQRVLTWPSLQPASGRWGLNELAGRFKVLSVAFRKNAPALGGMRFRPFARSPRELASAIVGL